MTSPRFSIRLSPEFRSALEYAAEAESKTLSAFIKATLQERLITIATETAYRRYVADYPEIVKFWSEVGSSKS